MILSRFCSLMLLYSTVLQVLQARALGLYDNILAKYPDGALEAGYMRRLTGGEEALALTTSGINLIKEQFTD